MINRPPENWKYNESLEMLFYFYQLTDELLSETTLDTYSLPLHNALSLVWEMDEVFSLLEKYNIVDEYYEKYIPPIIDEFIQKTEEDYILKKILGLRLSSVRTGFCESKKQNKLLSRWIALFRQLCDSKKYINAYKKEILSLVTQKNQKKKFEYCIKNYYISLQFIGYSREYLYITAKRFFSNIKYQIVDTEQLNTFLKLLTCKAKKFDYLILMDLEVIDYIEEISERTKIYKGIQKINIEKERAQLCKNNEVSELFKQYDERIRNSKKYEKPAIVKYTGIGFDPYVVAEQFFDRIRFLNTFKKYFKHYYSSQFIYLTLHINDQKYNRLSLPNKLQKRPYISQELIDRRIKNILNAESMGFEAFTSIASAIDMHAEAYDARNTSTLLRLFWTAIETLFSSPSANYPRENVINSVVPIIQKTYILKILRNLHNQLLDAISNNRMKDLGVFSFEDFVSFFALNKKDSSEMKQIYYELSSNPLLRSRLYNTRSELDNSSNIIKILKQHEARVCWQLQRIYRIRNVATHLGREISGLNTVVNHLHNYFDYTVNYILCKIENGDYVDSVSAVVFESKNDNRIQYETLKESQELTAENYLSVLFGPDDKIINYYFQ